MEHEAPQNEVPDEFHRIADALDLVDPEASLNEKRAAWDRLYAVPLASPVPRP